MAITACHKRVQVNLFGLKKLLPLLLLWPTAVCAFDEPKPQGSHGSSLAVDAGLWIATYAMETYWIQPEGINNFPTSSIDKYAREKTHGPQVDAEYTSREMAWRNYSDAGITGMVAGAIASPFATKGPQLEKLSLVSRSFAVNNFATTFLKNAVHRSRPKPSLNPTVEQDGDNAKSFPSGHSSNAMVAATSIVLMTPDKPAAFHAVVYGLGASIGLARIMADRHFLTDVLVGGALGYGITRSVFTNQKQDTNVIAGLTSIGFRFVF